MNEPRSPRCRPGFTLIELLVVVAIIALLISILLPSLKCAREKARIAKCGVQLRALSRGVQTYATEYAGWFPGVNTSGVAARAARSAEALRRPDVPVQSWDWMSPALRYETDLGNTRAERLRTLVTDFACPTQQGWRIDYLYPTGLQQSPDAADFTPEIVAQLAPLSYLMPAHFQWWGQSMKQRVVGRSPLGRPLLAEAAWGDTSGSAGFAAYHRGDYTSRIDRIGPPAEKVLAADGMRYLTENDEIDFDPSPAPRWFGAFASNGAWWAGSQAYGVKSGTKNWDGMAVTEGSESRGHNLLWSYRHGCAARSNVTQSVFDNDGAINAAFFDGHVVLLEDRASRNIKYWYPTGAMTRAGGALNGLTDVPNDWTIP